MARTALLCKKGEMYLRLEIMCRIGMLSVTKKAKSASREGS
jgi:hypothetical protein